MKWRITFLLMMCRLAYAWDGTGHQLIAELAYQALTPVAQQRVQHLLHELDPYYPKVNHIGKAAAWMDWLPGEGVSVYKAWHYIDLPYAVGVMAQQPKPPHVVWAIEKSYAVMQHRRSNRLQKALFMRFLLHLVADIHQPMHCVSRFDRYHPKGDHGGNDYAIKWGLVKQLHALWDRAGGLFRNKQNKPLTWKQRKRLLEKIKSTYPSSSLREQMQQHQTPMSWAQESHALARSVAYQIAEGSEVTEAYLKQVRSVSERQVALAAWRLADLLENQ